MTVEHKLIDIHDERELNEAIREGYEIKQYVSYSTASDYNQTSIYVVMMKNDRGKTE